MADPLSVLGSVVGVVSLGIQVTQQLVDLYNTYEGQSSDVGGTLRNLRSLTGTLELLRTATESHALSDDDPSWVEKLRVSIIDCEDAIQELEETCQKCTKHSKSKNGDFLKVLQRQVAYPFRKNTLKKLNLDVGEARDNLAVLLQIVQLKQTAKSQDDHDDLKALLETFHSEQIKSDIRRWLNAPDTTVEHNLACEKKRKNPGSGRWLLEDPRFTAWLEQENSLLWLKGFAGSGKSVLCSTMIQSVFQKRRGNNSVGIAFFYFTFTDKSKQDLSSMLRTLVWQFSCQAADGPKDLLQLYEAYISGTPPNATLLAYLQRLIGRFSRTYIFLDALDECPRTEGREDLLETLQEVREWSAPGVRLFVTSRDESDIRQSLDCASYSQIEMRNEGIDEDIAKFITRQLNDQPQLRRLSSYHDQIKAALTQGAKGVFRWVECQLRSLRNCPRSEHYVTRTLESLPQSLDATYERIFCGIDDLFVRDVQRIMTLLCYARRPLTVRELIDAVAVDISGLRGLNLAKRLQDVDDIRDLCSGLIEVSFDKESYHNWDDTYPSYSSSDEDSTSDADCVRVARPYKQPVIRFAHYSVQEYMESTRIFQSKARNFGLDSSGAHHELAKICLIYLLEERLWQEWERGGMFHFKFKQLPLVKYAARFWYTHYTMTTTSVDELDRLATDLFRNPRSIVPWLQFFPIYRPWDHTTYCREPESVASSIYYASYMGLTTVLSVLINEQPEAAVHEEVNGQEWYVYPMHVAASRGHNEVVQILLDNGADINAGAQYHGITLEAALAGGNVEIVDPLLEQRISSDPSRAPTHGARAHYLDNERPNIDEGPLLGSALAVASYSGKIETVRFLLEKGADVNAQGGIHSNALRAASKSGSADIVQLLLEKGADVNLRVAFRSTALQVAASAGDAELARLLLDRGASIDAQGCTGSFDGRAGVRFPSARLCGVGHDVGLDNGYVCTALQDASAGGSIEVVQLLLDRGADINTYFPWGRYYSALSAAAFEGHDGVVQLLLDRGACLDDEALCIASFEGNFEVVESLLERGANINVRSARNCEVPLEAASIANRKEVVQLLLARGANIECGALAKASSIGWDDIVRLLLEQGADVNGLGAESTTALTVAASRGSDNIVQLLLEKGADINTGALHAASWHGHVNTVQLLVDRGADVHARNGKGGDRTEGINNPLTLALIRAANWQHCHEIVQILLNNGAHIDAQEIPNLEPWYREQFLKAARRQPGIIRMLHDQGFQLVEKDPDSGFSETDDNNSELGD